MTTDSSKDAAVWQSKWLTRMTRNRGQVAHFPWRTVWTSPRGPEGKIFEFFKTLKQINSSVNFTDLDRSTQDLSVEEDRTDSPSQWNGLKLIPTFIASRAYCIETKRTNEIFTCLEAPSVSVTIQTDDPDRYIRSGMELPVFIRDGKFRFETYSSSIDP